MIGLWLQADSKDRKVALKSTGIVLESKALPGHDDRTEVTLHN